MGAEFNTSEQEQGVADREQYRLDELRLLDLPENVSAENMRAIPLEERRKIIQSRIAELGLSKRATEEDVRTEMKKQELL